MRRLRKIGRHPAAWVVVALLLVASTALGARQARPPETLRLDEFEAQVAQGRIKTAEINDRAGVIEGELVGGRRYRATYLVADGPALMQRLRQAGGAADGAPGGDGGPPGATGGGIEVKVDHKSDPLWWTLLQSFLPVLLLIGAFVFVMNTMGAGGGRALKFGRSKSRRPVANPPKVTFADVAGADEAVEELAEIREFLAEPSRFVSMGARIPKGVLLYGPPGTGKTLLARAVAGEAGVPFYSISGSDFVEMFVGVGASRVRDLFEQAKASAPAIIFVDEIDAVGRHRGAGLGGGHDEREQTLNQLLVEMDGFDATSGVILLAATNRPDILDPALLRPGRFDRQIVVDRPDLAGRQAILEVHSQGKPLAAGIDVSLLARRTPGFTGADLANLMNESALLTARRGFKEIGMPQLEEAIDRVIGGPERRSRLISESERQVIAYHEAGHALVGHTLPDADPIHKISIVSRGRSLGWTLALPTEDRYLVTRSALRDQLAMLMGGRAAEELVFGDPTTGAQNDIEKATHIARAMVTEYGMSASVGPQQLSTGAGEVFLGRDMGHQAVHSDVVAAQVDGEVRRLLGDAFEEATEILISYRATLDRVADALVAKETLDTAEVAELLAGVPERARREEASVPPPRHIRPVSNP
ncbi:MAG: ATP-dependent zinc metalloprotease FtsH [Acidimicrobiales bacterium]